MFGRYPFALSLAIAIALATVAQAAEVAFDLRVERGQVPQNLRRIRVTQGDAVTLRWTADRAMVLHLHGYDIEAKIEPGKVAVMSFSAHATGRFAVSVHTSKRGGGHSHDPPLTHIEVRPR
jgi:hypothetical protein